MGEKTIMGKMKGERDEDV